MNSTISGFTQTATRFAGNRAVRFLAAWLTWSGFAIAPWSSGAPAALYKPPRPHASDRLFETGIVPTFKIDILETDLRALRKKPGDYVKCVIKEGAMEYVDVAIRVKGEFSPSKGIQDKPSFSLNLDLFNDDQRFFGLDKIHLNNSREDPTYLRDWISSELFLAAGIPTARTTHARVSVNGNDLGLYVLKEGYDKTFLKRHFRDHRGNFYDGGNRTDISEKLQRDSGSGPTDWRDLENLLAVAQGRQAEARLGRLGEVVMLPELIRMLALEVLVGHQHGYGLEANNYRVYMEPLHDQAVFIPHGLDGTFRDSTVPLSPAWKGLLGRAVLETGSGRLRYQEELVRLSRELLKEDQVISRLDSVQKRLKPLLAGIDPALAQAQQTSVEELKAVIKARSRFCSENLKTLTLSGGR